MKLIREEVLDVNPIFEEKNGKKHLYLEGIYMQGGIVNRNGRLYPPDVLNREVNRYVKESVNTNRAYGELGHPDKPKLNLDRVSHRIVSLKRDGNDWIGKAVVIPEGLGKVAMGIVESGGCLGMSCRGLGSLKEDKKAGHSVVQDDYKLVVGADIVSDPSAPDAFVKGIMEGVEWFYEAATGRFRAEKVDDLVRHMHRRSARQLDEEKLDLWRLYLSIFRRG